MQLDEKELAEAQAKAPAHARRFEKVETAAGVVILCNASKAQWNAHQAAISIGANMNALQGSRAQEGLFMAMTVIPDAATIKQWCDEWPALASADEVLEAMQRLNGARAK